jgi:predicted thioesterase
MLSVFQIGDKKKYQTVVKNEDVAAFHGETVHSVYATFAIARDAEWAGRLFVLEMVEKNEEGIGTFVNVEHLAPAFVGEEVVFEAQIDELFGNTINCSFTAKVGERLIAKGRTGQKIILKEKLNRLFDSYK